LRWRSPFWNDPISAESGSSCAADLLRYEGPRTKRKFDQHREDRRLPLSLPSQTSYPIEGVSAARVWHEPAKVQGWEETQYFGEHLVSKVSI
jgi:hypothetical protein